jgi:hypothetical protein
MKNNELPPSVSEALEVLKNFKDNDPRTLEKAINIIDAYEKPIIKEIHRDGRPPQGVGIQRTRIYNKLKLTILDFNSKIINVVEFQ